MLKQQWLLKIMTVGLLLFSTIPTLAQTTNNSSSTSNRTLTRVLFQPPPEDKKPEQTRGAGSRHEGQCMNDATLTNLANFSSNQTAMIPLVPRSDFGLTLAARPKFWIYLPETSAEQVVLSIREEGINHHSQTFIPITGNSGIISLQLSPNAPPLEVGKAYQWAVVLVCGERPGPNDPAIASWVRRVALSEPTNQRSALEQAAWYGEQGIWYDALAALAEARQSQPNHQELTEIWTDFLESGGVESPATQANLY